MCVLRVPSFLASSDLSPFYLCRLPLSLLIISFYLSSRSLTVSPYFLSLHSRLDLNKAMGLAPLSAYKLNESFVCLLKWARWLLA